jgi:putative endonuclease
VTKRLTGQKGEAAARAFLLKNGYEIITANYFTRQGELDIVALEAKELVFVEVKTRRGQKFGTAAEAVTRTKRRRVMSAALTYLREAAPACSNYRFDVIEVYLDQEDNLREINHLKAAFTYD